MDELIHWVRTKYWVIRSKRFGHRHALPALITSVRNHTNPISLAIEQYLASASDQGYAAKLRIPTSVAHSLRHTLEQFGNFREPGVPPEHAVTKRLFLAACYATEQDLDRLMNSRHPTAPLLVEMGFLSFLHHWMSQAEDALVDFDGMPMVLDAVIELRDSIARRGELVRASLQEHVVRARSRDVRPDVSGAIAAFLTNHGGIAKAAIPTLAIQVWGEMKGSIHSALMAAPRDGECYQDEIMVEYGFMLFRAALLMEYERYLWGNLHESELMQMRKAVPTTSPVVFN
jgi:hypothetical protein